MTQTMTASFKELKPGSFIYELTHALDVSVCRDMIERFEAGPIR